MDGELELDLALVLCVDLEDLALGTVVRMTQHKGRCPCGEQLLHQYALHDRLEDERAG